jgi:hypothetical protein
MNNDEEMVGIDVDPRNVVSLPGALDRHRVKAKVVGQRPFGSLTPFRYVKPKEPVGARAKCAELAQITLAHLALVDPPQLHCRRHRHLRVSFLFYPVVERGASGDSKAQISMICRPVACQAVSWSIVTS